MKIKTLTLATLLTLLTACGFQLRGQTELADHIQPVFINDESNSSLGIEVRNLLNINNIQLAQNAASANYKLTILEQRSDRRNLSIGANANAVEFQLIETATFVVQDKENQTVVGPKTITERRIMRNDPDQIISKGEEEALTRSEMERNLASKIARQLSAIGRTPAE